MKQTLPSFHINTPKDSNIPNCQLSTKKGQLPKELPLPYVTLMKHNYKNY
jgi:hypothetical protein